MRDRRKHSERSNNNVNDTGIVANISCFNPRNSLHCSIFVFSSVESPINENMIANGSKHQFSDLLTRLL